MNPRHRGRWSVSRTVLTAVVAVLALVGKERAVLAATTTIDFDFLPNGEAPTDGMILYLQYASQGVTFEPQDPNEPGASASPIVVSSGFGPIPNGTDMFEAMGPNYSTEFDSSPFNISFAAPQSLVQFYGGSDCSAPTGTLTAYNALGTIVATEVLALTPDHTNTLFVVSRPQQDIMSISFNTTPAGQIASCDQSIDDLTFQGASTPVAPPPPTIALTAPVAGNTDYAASASCRNWNGKWD